MEAKKLSTRETMDEPVILGMQIRTLALLVCYSLLFFPGLGLTLSV